MKIILINGSSIPLYEQIKKTGTWHLCRRKRLWSKKRRTTKEIRRAFARGNKFVYPIKFRQKDNFRIIWNFIQGGLGLWQIKLKLEIWEKLMTILYLEKIPLI